MATTKSKQSTYLYFGGMASCVGAIVVHPLNLTKVFYDFMLVYSASVMRQATYSTVRFGVYEKLKQSMSANSQSLNVWKLLICSSVAGAVGGINGNPADVRMQNDGQLPLHQRCNYKNVINGFIRMSQEEDIISFFRGLGPNVNRAILMTSSQCVPYSTFKDLLLHYSSLNDGLTLHFISSVLASLVATTVCNPVDVIKTRVISSNNSQASFLVMTQMYKMEGLGSFFKGWTPAFIRLGPQTIITFVVLEQLKT